MAICKQARDPIKLLVGGGKQLFPPTYLLTAIPIAILLNMKTVKYHVIENETDILR